MSQLPYTISCRALEASQEHCRTHLTSSPQGTLLGYVPHFPQISFLKMKRQFPQILLPVEVGCDVRWFTWQSLGPWGLRQRLLHRRPPQLTSSGGEPRTTHSVTFF